MKMSACLVVACAILSGSVVECKTQKTLVDIMTKGKLVQIAEDMEKLIEGGLNPDDIVKLVPKFEKLIPELIEQSLILLPIAKEVLEPGLKDYAAEKEKKMIKGVNNFKEAFPRLRKEGYPIVNAGTWGPRFKVTENQFQRGLDNVEKYLKHVNFSNC